MQVEAWKKANPAPYTPEEALTMRNFEVLHRALRNKWDKMRDEFCPSRPNNNERCICKEHPKYESFYLGELIPVVNKINAIFHARYNRESIGAKEFEAFLHKARAAKQKYLKTV